MNNGSMTRPKYGANAQRTNKDIMSTEGDNNYISNVREQQQKQQPPPKPFFKPVRVAAVIVLFVALNTTLSSLSCANSKGFQFVLSGWKVTLATQTRSTVEPTSIASKPSSAIFYNIFIDDRDTANGIRIIKEQTQQMYQLLSERKQPIPTLYYNMIGHNYTEPFCPSNMTCLLNNYYPKAFEEVTIQDLYQYCQEHPRDIVYYLHNKGSYTPGNRANNERWRVSLTDFLFRRGTTYLKHDDDNDNRGCNAAGEAWNPHNFWHFPGNFWLAKCSYVRKLLPPKDYDIASHKMILDLLSGSHKKPTSPHFCLASYIRTMYDEHPGWANLVIGMKRFIYEKWISSHPDLVPCDTEDTVFNTTFHMFDTSWHTKHWSHLYDAYQYDWKRMYGRLYEFQYLYGKIPPNTSFFWKYYANTETPTLPKECEHYRKGSNLTAYPML